MEALKRQVLPRGLWVVATPIGNLGDLTPRARGALEEADAILCEDTRRTSQLLSALGIGGKRLERLDAHASPARIDELAARLAEGASYALVSDAGTPAISDPGSALVRRAREQGVVVTPLPGASAVLALLSAAGFEQTAFVFRGFFPRKAGEREKELALARSSAASGLARVFVWLESPERLAGALALVAEREPACRVVAAKELTKLHERFFAGSAREASEAVSAEIEREGARGEWSFALLLEEPEGRSDEGAQEWGKALRCLLRAGVSASMAARQVSQEFGAPRNDVYEAALRLAEKK